ncbi:R3H domain-containing nucleic acid-binding protein [Dactylosporangium sp. NPDC005555]|uniref:Jag family protein n=1 Tax=Dactylosporangium sp. NPDC005555 TaxID=3154889 RepID=UPI0033BF1320
MSFVTDTTSDLDARGTEGDALDQDANLDEVEDGDDAGDAADTPKGDGDAAPAASGGNGRAAADLFRESEIAADYVEGLLDILDYDGDIDELVVSGRPVVEVVEGGDGSGRRLQALVGQRGATLEALQELSRLAVFRQTGSPSRLLLDVGGYRALRRKELGAIAKNAAEKVKEYGEAVRLEPMSAFERKCVHDVINALPGVESESEGVEPARRIVVRPVA